MFKEKYEKLGKNIRYYRIMRGMGQACLAEKAGITPQYLSKLEHGAAKPSMDLLFKIAQELQVKAEALLKE